MGKQILLIKEMVFAPSNWIFICLIMCKRICREFFLALNNFDGKKYIMENVSHQSVNRTMIDSGFVSNGIQIIRNWIASD